MRKIYCLLLLFVGFATFAQHSSNEQFPMFPDCVNAIGKQQESCFYNTIQNYFYNFIYFGYALCPVLIVVMNQKYQETI